jgi:outer membrane receptor protein involved in Fe transport
MESDAGHRFPAPEPGQDASRISATRLKQAARPGGRLARGWLMALIWLSMAASATWFSPAAAQTEMVLDETVEKAGGAREFSIGPLPLEEALIEFARQSDAIFVAPGSVFDGKMANAVRGMLMPGEALRRLLAGTGFAGEIRGGRVRTLAVFEVRNDNQEPSSEEIKAMAIAKRSRFSKFLSGLAAVMSAAGSAHALAQSDVPEGPLEEVVVTGSRIQRQDFTATSPIVTVEADTFENTSTIGIETVLNQLPQFVPALTEFSSTTLQATATTTPGASIVNLRGLGSFRTLTLVDGRRAQPLNASLAVDTNSIPSSAVQRVEIISGGASAVYGADAVAGVVNFILKDDYEGMDVSARWGTTEEGDGEQLQVSALIGTEFAEGRGNVMLGAEYAKRSRAYDIDREWKREQLSDPFIAGTEALVAETYIDFGRAGHPDPTQAAINAIFTALPACSLPNGTGTPCPTPDPNDKYFVNRAANGAGTLFTGANAFFGTNGNAGSYRYTGPLEDPDYPGLPYRKITADGVLHENNLSALTTVPLDRYSMFAKAEYDITDRFTAYLRGNFAHTQTDTATQYNSAVNNWGATIPVGFEGTLWADSRNANGTTKAAYLPGGAYGVNCPAMGGCTESQAFPLPPELEALLRSRGAANMNADIDIHRVMDWLPERQTHNRNVSFQITGGLEGELPNEWSWDVSLTHGISEAITILDGVADLAQYRAIVGSPNYGVNFFKAGLSPTSSGLGVCTSGLPIFRDIAPSQDCIDTVSADMQTTSQIQQTVAEVNLTGDLFELPAGLLQFAAGAAYRDYGYEFINDHLNETYTFASQAIGYFARSTTKDVDLNTKEIYGELLIPIVSDLPFVEQFNLELGGRYSDWNTSGGVETYKILGDWTIVPWARLRGGYNRATRAPHIAEFFLGREITTSTLVSGDPCSRNNQISDYSANPGKNPNAAQVEALCRALMTTAAADVYYSVPVSQQPSGILAGITAYRRGNPELEPETADTFTAGVVLRSPIDNPWLSGLDLTADYYSIEIDEIIAVQSADEVWRQCVLSNSAASIECGPTFRDPFDGRLTLTDLIFSNRGNLTFSGVDIQLNWNAQFGDLGMAMIPGGLSISSQITVPFSRRTQDGPTAPVRQWVGTSGCDLDVACSGYDFQVFSTINYFYDRFSASLRWNYYPTIESSAYATDSTTRIRGVFESYNVFSLTGSYSMTDAITLRAGIDNIFDHEPPLSGGTYAADGNFVNTTNPPTLPSPATPSIDARYDQLGRRFFVGMNLAY